MKGPRLKPAVLYAMLALLQCGWVSASSVPHSINFQGRLTDADGNLITGTKSIEFSIWDSGNGGARIWGESQSVAVSTGIYNVSLGEIEPLSPAVFDSSDRWLELRVAEDEPMSPRLKIRSVAYALVAETARSLAPTGFGVSIATNLVVGAGARVSTWTAYGDLSIPGTLRAARIIAPEIIADGECVSSGTSAGASGSYGSSPIFPDGLGSVVPMQHFMETPYTVPEGMNFYVTNIDAEGEYYLSIPGLAAYPGTFYMGSLPLIAPSGTQIKMRSDAPFIMTIMGFLVPAKVSVVLTDLEPGAMYTVPEGKNLWLMTFAPLYNSIGESRGLTAGSISIGFPSQYPVALGPGQHLKNENDYTITINGYLRPN